MTRHSPIVHTDHLTNIIASRCDDFGITVEYCPYAKTASTNGKKIKLPVIKNPITIEALDKLYGYVIHECGHHVRSEAFDILMAAKPPEHLCAIYNVVEDDGMERERALEWRGDAKALSRMNELLMGEAADLISSPDTNIDEVEPTVALLLNQYSRIPWDSDAEHQVARILRALPDEATRLLAELVDEGWVDRFQSTETPLDTWNVAVDLAKRLYPDNDQDEYEEIRQAGLAMGQWRDDNDSSFTDAQSKQSSGQSTDEDGEAAKEEGSTVSWKDVVLSEHNEWEQGDGKPGSVGITWQDYQASNSVAMMPTHQVNVIDLDKSKANIDGGGWWNDSWERFMPSEANSRAFANKIRRYIQAQARSTVDREKYHGKIDKQSIIKLKMPPINGGDWNKRIFYDQRKHTMKDTAIFVLVDWSGSMQGHKMHYAADAAQRLVWCFDRVLNVPVALAAFSNRKTICDVGYVKRFNTRGKTAESIAQNFAKFQHWTSGNDDADAVHWAYNELKKRKEHRKILIVLSDGAPTGSFTGSWGHRELQWICEQIEADKEVDLYGVGICDQAVKEYYSHYRVVNDPSEINQVLFNLIKDGNNGRKK